MRSAGSSPSPPSSSSSSRSPPGPRIRGSVPSDWKPGVYYKLNRMFPGVEVPVDTISVKIDVSGVLVEAEMAARGRRPCFRRIQTIQFLTSRQLRPKCARSSRSACRPTESKSVEALIWFNTSRLGLLYTLQPAP